jgi:hypothetical protein
MVCCKAQPLATPKSYVAAYTSTPPAIDGNPDGEVWAQAAWTDWFEDIEGGTKDKPYFTTRAKILWDRNYLYIAAELQDKHVWAYVTKRDEIVFHDNDFEVFIDPDNTAHRYFEFEINALNTIFDLFLPKPYRAGSGALISWDSKGLKHAVKVHGSLNNPADEDLGWSLTMAIPFADITIGNLPHVPRNGEIWRINFSRVEWDTTHDNSQYIKKKNSNGMPLPEHNWVWSPQGKIDMHMPERWGYLLFSDVEAGSPQPVFELPYSERQRQQLWQVYYKQQQYLRQNKRFAQFLSELGIEPSLRIDGIENQITMDATPYQFMARINSAGSRPIQLNEEGYVMAW